jgi:Mrp family chromosome partitioning ATPase
LIKRMLMDTYWGKLDFLIIDTPPGTSDEHLSVIAALKQASPTGAVLVTTPQDLSFVTVMRELNFCRKMMLPVLGVVENMAGFVCPCCGEVEEIFSSGAGEKMCKQNSLQLLGRIPLDPQLGLAADTGVWPSFQDSKLSTATQNAIASLILQLTATVK